MLMALYQRLEEGQKLLLADVFLNPLLYELIQRRYTEIQIALVNIEEEVNESADAFRLKYKLLKQQMVDIEEFHEFMEKGKEFFRELEAAKNAELNLPDQQGEQQNAAPQ